MHSFLCTAFAFLSLASCTITNSIKGNIYTLVEPKYNPEIIIGFDKTTDRYYGKVVNNYFGTYAINNDKIKFEFPASTMMMGAPGDMEAERLYLTALEGEKTIEVKNDKLILKDSKSTLTFKKK